MALSYTNITASTLKYYEKTLFDNVFKAKFLLEKLMSTGQIKEYESGEKIFIPLEYGENTNVGWIKKSGTIPLNEDQLFTAAEDAWRILAGAVKFNDLDAVLNRGAAQIFDLMKGKIKNLEKTMKHNLADALHTAQTGDAMNGLPDIVSTTTTLHGIAVADMAVWIAGYADNTAEPLSIIDMATAYNTLSDGNEHPNLIDASQTLYEKYESLVTPQLRFSDARSADAGFETLRYKSGVVGLDKEAASDRMYFLNTDYLYIACVKDRKFHAFPAVAAANQIEEAVKVVFYGNLMCSNRSKQGMLDGRTA
jgi:hypothetical protein